MKKTVGTLLHDMANEMQIVLIGSEKGVFSKQQVKDAANNTAKKIHSLNSLPPEILGIDLSVASTPHVPCELRSGDIVTREKARERWSPSSKECQDCKACQV